MLRKLQPAGATGLLIVPKWTTQAWFSCHAQDAHCTSLLSASSAGPPASTSRIICCHSHCTGSLELLAVHLSGVTYITSVHKALIRASWRDGTHSRYDSVLRGWGSFCLARQANPSSPSIEDVLVYLTSLYEQGLQYNTFCTARSALSGILHVPGVLVLSDHPLI